MLATWTAAVLLALIAIAHSLLGEKILVRPLVANPNWTLPVLPRAQANRLVRFAWHLTTIAWLALAIVLVGVPVAPVFAALCLGSAGFILMMMPGHVAWPPFLAAGLITMWSIDALPTWLLWSGVIVGAASALVAAGFHILWACGSRIGTANVIPQRPTPAGGGAWEPAALPTPLLTFTVALALISYSGLVVASATGAPGPWIGWLLVAALVVLTARVLGDGTWMGVTKRVRKTGFARADDRFWTPAAALLALGAAAALVV